MCELGCDIGDQLAHREGVSCTLCGRASADLQFAGELESPTSIAEECELLHEIGEKLGVAAYKETVQSCYNRMRQKLPIYSLNVLMLSAHYFVCNQEGYLPAENLVKYAEGCISPCKLFERMQYVIVKSGLFFPRPTINNLTRYACDRLLIKPRNWVEITSICNKIKEAYLSHRKCMPQSSNLVAAALHIFDPRLEKSPLCKPSDILYVSSYSYKRTLTQIRKWRIIPAELKSFK